MTQAASNTQRLTGAQIVAEYLVRSGVTHAAGIPGHGVWTLTDALRDRPEIQTVQV
ncbi:MAG: thiamine pyrophosphate-binding protein, partial [Candidatus Limnocylindria bacterium]